jgi:predicted ribosome quality control (RQC) complex YloA/Tae2 family protein
MGKTRFTSLDVRCLVRDIKTKIVGLRVANLYDVNNRTYIFKLAKPEQKVFLLVESGIRIHTTKFSREKKEVPSVFTLKLRKHIRTKRLENVEQVGMDRIVDFTFGTGPVQCHILVELYAAGNVILTDSDYKILTLLRPYKTDEDSTIVAVGQTYPIGNSKKMEMPTASTIQDLLKANSDLNLKEFLTQNFPFGAEMIEHIIQVSKLSPRSMLSPTDTSHIDILVKSLQDAFRFAESSLITKGYIVCVSDAQSITQKQSQPHQKKEKKKKKAVSPTEDIVDDPSKENISQDTEPTDQTKPKTNTVEQEQSFNDREASLSTITGEEENISQGSSQQSIIYDVFSPFLYKRFEASKYIEFSDFDTAVDEFFSKIELQKAEQLKREKEANVLMKIEKVREDQKKRIKSLEEQERDCLRCAQLIEANASLVDQAIESVNGLLSTQMSWNQIKDLIKQERKKGDPVASIIHALKFEQNQITLLLFENTENVEEETHGLPAEKVDVNLSLSALANATEYYQKMKRVCEKKQKTMDSAEQALKAAEKKARKQFGDVQSQTNITRIRKPYWFEKFNWFISSDNYIIVCGRDMQQNELLYKKYLQAGDIYVHADISGASSCIIKNPSGGEVPPRTLLEAGNMSVCYSAAWAQKIVTSAYWVYHNQVSKTAPTGEYLTTGSFMIRGKKNYLPPASLQMGFGILFRVADESIPNHINERKPKFLQQSEDDNSVVDEEQKVKQEDQLHWQDKEQHSSQKNDGKNVSMFTNEKSKNGQTVVSTENLPKLSQEISNKELKDYKQEQEEKGRHEREREQQELEGEKQEQEWQKQDEKTKSRENEESNSEDDGEADDNDGSSEEYEILNSSKFSITLTRDDAELSSLSALSTTSENNEAVLTQPSSQHPISKKKMSAYERRQMKKLKEGKVPQCQTAEQPKEGKVKKQLPLPRGKKGKLKRMQKKYRNQDEEERRIAMELLASAGPKKSDSDSAKTTAKKGETEKYFTSEKLKQKRLQRQNVVQERVTKENEQDEIDQLLKEEKLEQLTVDDIKKIEAIAAKGLGVNLAALTGMPKKEDILLYAVPVCGPYEAMQNYKYKVKLTPGPMKRGKAAKLAVAVFLQHPEATPRELELIKTISESELCQTIISDCKVNTPGLQNVQRKTKNKK